MEITDVDLVEKLDTTIHVTRKQGEERASFQVEGIKQWAKNPRSGDKRSEERIEKVTTDSSVCEVAIAAALGGQVNTQEFVLFKEQKRSNTIHLDFNIITEAPGGVGNGGVIIPDNLHPVIKERLNVFLSNAGLGAEGGTSANFNFGSVRAVRKDQDIFGKQNILAPEDQSIKSTINTTGFHL